LYDARPLADCPVCAEKIKPGVAVCKSCGAILDREKAAQFGLVAKDERFSLEGQRQKEKREKEAGK
jgi:predicted nucleic acid-binding Zn ribbon protein